MAKIVLIAACDKNYGIGLKGKLPWDIPEDMLYFQRQTRGQIVIMGRTTFESLPPKGLPGRVIFVVSNQTGFIPGHEYMVYHTVESALKEAKQLVEDRRHKTIFVAGGAQIYEAYREHYTDVYLTFIDKEYVVDTHLPRIEELVPVSHEEYRSKGEDNVNLRFFKFKVNKPKE